MFEAQHLAALAGAQVRRLELDLQPDPTALGLGPGGLLGDHLEFEVGAADPQRRRVVVAGERTEAVQDLVEDVLGAEAFEDLALDALVDQAGLGVVDPAQHVGQGACEPVQESPVAARERRGVDGPERDHAPAAASTTHRRDHHLVGRFGATVLEHAGEEVEVPVGRAARDLVADPGAALAVGAVRPGGEADLGAGEGAACGTQPGAQRGLGVEQSGVPGAKVVEELEQL